MVSSPSKPRDAACAAWTPIMADSAAVIVARATVVPPRPPCRRWTWPRARWRASSRARRARAGIRPQRPRRRWSTPSRENRAACAGRQGFVDAAGDFVAEHHGARDLAPGRPRCSANATATVETMVPMCAMLRRSLSSNAAASLAMAFTRAARDSGNRSRWNQIAACGRAALLQLELAHGPRGRNADAHRHAGDGAREALARALARERRYRVVPGGHDEAGQRACEAASQLSPRTPRPPGPSVRIRHG